MKPQTRSIQPAIALFFLAPLVAEFLLGNLPIKLLPALVMLAPMYGGAALLIREMVRRAGRGWPSILLLGLAYGILEEAVATQSLFNPDYLGMHIGLLKSAYIPVLRIGGWWTIFVLNLHTAWSIMTPIALVEGAVPERSQTPWLGRVGFAVTALIFAIGVAAMTMMSYRHDRFVAWPSQFAWAGCVCAVLIAVAFQLPRRVAASRPGGVPNPWTAGGITLACGSAVLLVPRTWGWWAVLALLAIDLTAAGLIWPWSRRAGWDQRYIVAAAGGAALAYGWHAFIETPIMAGGLVARIGNAIFAAGALALIWLAAKRSSRAARGTRETALQEV
jgi:hypothetical protein